MERDIIFISHTTPQDNYFAAWLYAKLKDLGYHVWLDLEDISAGDSFNTVIRPIIQEKAKIFIATTTKTYATKAKDQNSGVSRELNCATTIDIKSLGNNFIIPIRVDDIEYDDFPYHYLGWNSINFYGNWQQGLIDLFKELDKIKIPKSEDMEDPITVWFNAIKSQNRVIPRKEKYYSNWFKLHLPENIYVHQPELYTEEDIYKIPYPLIIESYRIISFMKKESTDKFTQVKNCHRFAIESFFSNDELRVDNDFVLKEPRKKLIRLLNKSFQQHLSAKGLICWSRGERRKHKIFYFRNTPENRKPISLGRYSKSRSRRILTGRSTEIVEGERKIVNWHFALKAEADLEPIPHYKLFYAVVFTDKNFKRFDKELHHRFRRSIPSDWYNRKWLETLLAAMLFISPSKETEHISVSIDDASCMVIENEPFYGISEIGYYEPQHVE